MGREESISLYPPKQSLSCQREPHPRLLPPSYELAYVDNVRMAQAVGSLKVPSTVFKNQGLRMNSSHRHCSRMRKTGTSSSQTGSQHWKGHRLPPLTKMISVTDTHWQRENRSSPVGCHYVNYHTLGQATLPGVTGQTQTCSNTDLVCVWCPFVSFGIFFILSVLCLFISISVFVGVDGFLGFLFCLFEERWKKKHEVERIKGMRRLW